MFDPASALTIYSYSFEFLDISANALDKSGRTSQDTSDVEHAAQVLADAEKKEDVSNTRPSGKSTPEIKQTEPEKAVQGVYERVKKFADRIVPALQPSLERVTSGSSTKSGNGAKKDKGDTEKLRKDLETIRLECARSLIQLLSKGSRTEIERASLI